MVVVLPLSIMAVFSLSPDLGELTERAALISAMVNMPEGSLALLESRFADKIDPAYYQGEESQVAPYVAPFDEEDASAAPQGLPESSPVPAKQVRVADPSPAADNSHPVPAEYRGRIVQENMAGSGDSLIPYGEGLLRNYTEVPADDIREIMEQGLNIRLEDTPTPQVLIFHTHATESYEPYDSENYDMRNTWRSTDNTKNMVAVGNALEKALRDAGIGVVHDTTQHDYPSYNGSYANSYRSIKRYLEQYPTIKVVLDLHRDAIEREGGLIVKPTAEIGGEKYAQLMIVSNCDDGTGLLPNWRENLRFAGAFCARIEREYPGLTRPILFSYRKYNQQLSTGALLLEFGSHASTLEEAKRTAEAAGSALAGLLLEGKSNP